MAERRRLFTLGLACAIYLAAGLVLAGVGPTLVWLAEQVGASAATVGAQYTSFSIGTVLVQALTGPLGLRLGQRAVLGVGGAMLGAGMLLETLSPSLGLLLLAAGLAGLGFGCVLAGGNTLVARLYAARAASALNLLNLFFGLGAILGPVVAGLGRAWLRTPPAALWLGAGLLLLLVPMLLLAAEPPAPPARAAVGAPATPWGLICMLGVLLLVYSGTEIAIGGWAALFLELGPGLDPTAAALTSSSFWVAFTLGRAAGALAGLRLGARTLLSTSLAGMLAGAALLWLGAAGSLPGAVAGLALLGFACGPVFPTAFALVGEVSGGRGAATGLVLAIGNIGGATLPPLLGLALSIGGAPAGALLLLGLAALLALVYAGYRAVEGRSAARPAPEGRGGAAPPGEA